MTGIVLFAVGSPIAVDMIESCRRLGRPVVAAIRNMPGDVFVDAAIPLLDADDVTAEIANLSFAIPLFNPGNRRAALADATARGLRTPAHLTDRTAIVAASTRVEAGTYLNAGCIVGGGGEIGAFVFLNRGANVGHHCRIGNFVSIGPGAILAGSVKVGEDALIGAGAVILPKVSIGAGAHIAPGAVVARDVPAGGFAAGNPARILPSPPGRAAADRNGGGAVG